MKKICTFCETEPAKYIFGDTRSYKPKTPLIFICENGYNELLTEQGKMFFLKLPTKKLKGGEKI